MLDERVFTKMLPARIVRRIGQVRHYRQNLWGYPVIPKGRYVAQHVVLKGTYPLRRLQTRLDGKRAGSACER